MTCLFQSVFNITESADIFVNATCGNIKYESETEVNCMLSSVNGGGGGGGNNYLNEQCGICNTSKEDKDHPIALAVDGEESWWQLPSLHYGSEYHYVTVTVDLKKVFQVAYILIQSGPSPRPGNWILERSTDGQQWAPVAVFRHLGRGVLAQLQPHAHRGKAKV